MLQWGLNMLLIQSASREVVEEKIFSLRLSD